MTTDEHVQRFLDAEEQASQLAEELSKLRDATENYSTAGKALDDAAALLSSTSAALLEIAEGVRETASTLREIGTPELLSAQQTLEAEVAGSRSDIGRLRAVLIVGGAVLLIAQAGVLILQIVG